MLALLADENFKHDILRGLRRCESKLDICDSQGQSPLPDGKKVWPHNDATPDIKVDPDTCRVWANGELLTCEPAKVLPMAQRYFLF